MRFNDNNRAIDLLRQAADEAERIGDGGYEVRIIANILLGFILPFVGLGTEANVRLDAVETLCRSQGDELHLGAILNNRSCLWIMMNDPVKFAADIGAVISLARKIGNQYLERQTQLNAGIFYYWRGEYDLSLAHAQRAIEMDEQRFRHGVRPEAAVLLIRILWAQGQLQAARQLRNEIREHQHKAVADKKGELILAPNDALIFDVISEILDPSAEPGARWDQLLARAKEVAQGQELIEILELRGIAAEAEAQWPVARSAWQEAIALSASIPNVMETRIHRRLDSSPPA